MPALTPDQLKKIDAYWRARQLSRRRSDLSLRQPAPARAAATRARQTRPPRPLGDHAGPEFYLRPPQPPHQPPRPQHDLHLRPRPRRARGSSATPTSKARTRKSTPRSRKTRPACTNSSGDSPSPAGSLRTSRRNVPVPYTKEANWAIRSRTRSARRLDNPDLVVACVVGDGEAESGPLATAWHSNKFLSPAGDGAVLPILHLNGYKIANPTIFARIPKDELQKFFEGCGWAPIFVEGHEPAPMHETMAAALDTAIATIKKFQHDARVNKNAARPTWPMIVLKSPKGWTGPKIVDGQQVEGTFRSHQVPLSDPGHNPEHLKQLESWLRSYKPEELFDKEGRLLPELAALAPKGDRRMGANPHANGGSLLRDLRMPDYRPYALPVPAPGQVAAEDTRVLGRFLRRDHRQQRKLPHLRPR